MCLVTPVLFIKCGLDTKKNIEKPNQKLEVSTANATKNSDDNQIPMPPIDGMEWISSSTLKLGAVPHDEIAMGHERPSNTVWIDGFYIDIHEVTNTQFKKFVDQTKYVTIAERELEWEELKKQLPVGTPKPHDSIMKPGSLTFEKSETKLPNLYDFSQWWHWNIGANWRRPHGPNSNIDGKENFPVVHIAYEDALAYCEWAERRLPTEAEWELAARGTQMNKIHVWGDDVAQLKNQANTWEGEFPLHNTKIDGYENLAPIQSYMPNDNGLYDMAGNVWEWTSDWYNSNYYKELSSKTTPIENPKGAKRPFNSNNPYAEEKVIKGGSFLCSASYCANYRVSARMATSMDSSMEHLGFRTVLK
ncbi:MAG: sulfatase [Flavobacteriaceae bacterium]|nr:MAG: sulfatase [Flavobacteriaceae bacterium]